MKITSRIPRSKGACASQVDLFKEIFPKGVVITEALCVEHADKFDWIWAALNLLSKEAKAECERVTAPACAEYERVHASAYAEYKRVRASAFGRLASGRNTSSAAGTAGP